MDDAFPLLSLVYLLLLLVLVVPELVALLRGHKRPAWRLALLWLMIFVGLGAGARLWQEGIGTLPGNFSRLTFTERNDFFTTDPSGKPIVLRQFADGHYYAELGVNGAPVRFMVDTGATSIVLTRADARNAGLNPDSLNFTEMVNTANGRSAIAPVILNEMVLGDVVARRVRAYVGGDGLEISLLGMAYLDRFSSIAIKEGKLELTP